MVALNRIYTRTGDGGRTALVTGLGSDVVGTADRRAVGQRSPGGRCGSRRRLGCRGDGRVRPRGSRFGGYFGGHGDSCGTAERGPSPC